MQIMITDKDITKLKGVFATKDDLKRFATKDDLKRFATKNDLQKFVTKNEFQRAVDELVKLITGGFGRIDLALEKMKEHDDLLEDHERRLGRVEDKVFA